VGVGVTRRQGEPTAVRRTNGGHAGASGAGRICGATGIKTNVNRKTGAGGSDTSRPLRSTGAAGAPAVLRSGNQPVPLPQTWATGDGRFRRRAEKDSSRTRLACTYQLPNTGRSADLNKITWSTCRQRRSGAAATKGCERHACQRTPGTSTPTIRRNIICARRPGHRGAGPTCRRRSDPGGLSGQLSMRPGIRLQLLMRLAA
jgi:hypothetical protein